MNLPVPVTVHVPAQSHQYVIVYPVNWLFKVHGPLSLFSVISGCGEGSLVHHVSGHRQSEQKPQLLFPPPGGPPYAAHWPLQEGALPHPIGVLMP